MRDIAEEMALTSAGSLKSSAANNACLPWSWFTKYSTLDAPEETQEKTDGKPKRTTTIEYDSAGRPLRTHTTGEGTAMPPVETTYDEETAAPVSQHFVCESECEGFDQQQLTTTYDDLGRPIAYEDADGNKSGCSYVKPPPRFAASTSLSWERGRSGGDRGFSGAPESSPTPMHSPWRRINLPIAPIVAPRLAPHSLGSPAIASRSSTSTSSAAP